VLSNKNVYKRKNQIFQALQIADKNKIDFLCFPEGFLTGYYAEYSLALENSLNVRSNDFQTFLDQISSFKTTIIIGFNEAILIKSLSTYK
jgi:predicted amidohydrolase